MAVASEKVLWSLAPLPLHSAEDLSCRRYCCIILWALNLGAPYHAVVLFQPSLQGAFSIVFTDGVMDEPVVASLAPEILSPKIPWTAADDLISGSVPVPFALINAVQKEECVGCTAITPPPCLHKWRQTHLFELLPWRGQGTVEQAFWWV